MAEAIGVSVVYAEPGAELFAELQLPAGATIADAVRAGDFPARRPGLDVSGLKVGIWGKLKAADTPLRDGDRVEIYRPLKADPNTARQHRVAKKRAAGGKPARG